MEGSELVQQLKSVGDRLLNPPASIPLLLTLLDEVVLLLSKIGQSPSKQIQDALVPTMECLITDNLMHISDPHVSVTLALCLHEIMRISAPVAPYHDHQIKQIFQLIVSSFNNLSSPPSPCYSKSLVILQSVARLRSCVMMLDLDCDSLLIHMFHLFHKHITSNHPHSVFLAMEKIMTVIIQESDSISQHLLQALFQTITKQNQNASPVSFDLGVKVVEECSEKLKEYIVQAVESRSLCLDDYAPILSSIYDNADKDLLHNSPTHLVTSEPHDSDDGYEGSKRNSSPASHHGLMNKSSATLKSEAVLTNEDEPSKRETEEATDLDNKKVYQATALGGVSEKKGKPTKKIISEGHGKKSATGLLRKDRIQSNDAMRSQKTRIPLDDDIIETPHGRKNYKEDLIGCRIKVWWPLDRRYYEGTISSFDAPNKKHKVDYDDGDQEVLNLRKEQWEFVGDEIPHIDLFVNKKTPLPCSNMSKREASIMLEKETPQTNTVMKIVDKVDSPECLSETKRLRLCDEERS